MFSGRKIRVVPYRHHPRLRWTISGYQINKKRVRRFFATKGEAETFVRQLEIKATNLGMRVTQIDQALHVMAVQCNDRLKPFGHTLTDATDFLLQHLKAVEHSCALEELIGQFLEDKRSDGISPRYEQELRSRLSQFTRAFERRTVATITTSEIDGWLRSLGTAPLTRNHSRRILHVLFSYAVTRRFAPENPVTKTAKAKVVSSPIQILTPEQTATLLGVADQEIVPTLAIGAFAGLRPAEVLRLSWQEVRLDRGFVEISAKKSKTATRRLVNIQPNLAAWLTPYAKAFGPVAPSGARKLIEAARIRAGFKNWPANGLRHSFASYHLAKFQDAAALALQMGHSTTGTLFAHYREVVTPQAAGEYWTIRPNFGKPQ